jgi:CBS domain-containing protein
MTKTAIAPSLLAATVQDLRRHVPFSEMALPHLEWMAGRLQLAYFPAGAVVLGPEAGVPQWFYVVKQGSVEAGGTSEDSVIKLLAGECFPLGALLADRAVVNQFRAAGDSFCYLLSAADFHALLAQSAVFRDFCTRRIASLLEQSQKAVQSEYALRQEEDTRLERSLASVCVRTPVSAQHGTPLSSALQAMRDAHVGSVAVTDEAGYPLGILTLKDVLSRVTLPGLPLESPIEAAMTADPVTLPVGATAREALLTMARHGIHHLLLVEDGKLTGVISEKDLFAIKRMSVQGITAAIANARDVETLQRAGRDIAALVHNLLAQGMEAATLTELIATLNDHLTRRLIDLEITLADLPAVHWCWMALGSEGRMEQTLATDQDNALIFVTGNGADVEAVRTRLIAFSRRINESLDACGFPLCKGGIMASNPKWCLTADEWRAQFSRWIDAGGPEELLNASIFFDFRPLHGEGNLAEDLRAWLTAETRGNPRFLKQMAQNALRNVPPLGLVRDFVLSDDEKHPHTLDLKLNGSMPFVDGARIFALASGQPATNTAQRLKQAGQAMGIPDEETSSWLQAFHFIQLLRLRHQHEQERRGLAPDNYLNPDTLSILDRRILKEAFRQARKLQARLALDYER